MPEWIDDKARVKHEMREALIDAGGGDTIDQYDLDAVAEFLLACQANGIDVWRSYDHGNPLNHRKLHVSHNPPLPE